MITLAINVLRPLILSHHQHCRFRDYGYNRHRYLLSILLMFFVFVARRNGGSRTFRPNITRVPKGMALVGRARSTEKADGWGACQDICSGGAL